MADSYTIRGGILLPEPGQHLDTWGQLLNDNSLAMIDKGMFGCETIVVTGDFALTRVNGDVTSTQINKAIRMTGTPTADFAVTMQAYEQVILFRNETTRSATVKMSAGTGVTLATGESAFLCYNAGLGDVTNLTPTVMASAVRIGGALTIAGKLSGVTAGSAATDGVNKAQMEAAISVLAGIIAGGLVLNSLTDTAAGYNTQKNTMGTDSLLTYSTKNPAANEYQELSDRRLRRRAYFIGQV